MMPGVEAANALPSLPVELLSHILQYVDQQSRVSVDSVCSSLRARLDPALWAAVYLGCLRWDRAGGTGSDRFLALRRWLARRGRHIKQLRIGDELLWVPQNDDLVVGSDMAAIAAVLSTLTAVDSPLAALGITGDLGESLCGVGLTFVGDFGRTLRQLSLRIISTLHLPALLAALERLHNLRDVEIVLEATHVPDEEHEADHEDSAPPSRRRKATDVLSTLAESAPRLRMVCLALRGDGRHSMPRNRRLPSQLAALPGLSTLVLYGLRLTAWPKETSQLTSLQTLLVADSSPKSRQQPLQHDLAALTGLQKLLTGEFGWNERFPAHLTSLAVRCPAGSAAAFPQLCGQLRHMAALRSLSISEAPWLQPQLPALLAALASCRQLRTLQLRRCDLVDGLSSLGAEDMQCISHIETLALHGNPRLLRHERITLPQLWTQLASCRAISLSLLAAGATVKKSDTFLMTPEARDILAAMPELRQLGLGCGSKLSAAMIAAWNTNVNAARRQTRPGAPPLEITGRGLGRPEGTTVEFKFEECNALLGQKLDGYNQTWTLDGI